MQFTIMQVTAQVSEYCMTVVSSAVLFASRLTLSLNNTLVPVIVAGPYETATDWGTFVLKTMENNESN